MKKVRYLLFLIVPTLFLIVGVNFNRAKYSNDPDYIYLMNALNICTGKSVGHVDNPGTTVMESGALVVWVSELFSKSDGESLVNSVITNPDKYIENIRIFWLLFNALMLIAVAIVTFQLSGSVWPPLLLQVSAFFSLNTIEHVWTKVSPEPLLFFITGILALVTVIFYFDKDKTSFRYLIYFALISGFGLATKATFLPVALFPLFLLPTLKKKLFYMAGTIVAFALFIMPAWHLYKDMYHWFRNLVFHTGIYGGGGEGIIDFSAYLPNIAKIIRVNPLFSIVIAASIIVIAVKFLITKRQGKEINWNFRILAGLTTSGIGGILMVAKHYNSNHYLLPVMALSGLTIYFLFLNSGYSKPVRILQTYFLPALTLFFVVFLTSSSIPKLKTINEGYAVSNIETNSVADLIKRDYPDHTLIYYYPYSLQKFSALNFGDVYARRKMSPYLKKQYPDTYFYNFIAGKLYNWNAEMTLYDILELKGNKLLLVGDLRDEQKVADLAQNGFPLKQIYLGRLQAIYELDTVALKNLPVPQLFSDTTLFICDAETVTSGNTLLVTGDGQTYGQASCRSKEEVRTGNYSFKIDQYNVYALELKITNLKVGDLVKIGVWKKPDNFEAFIVADDEAGKDFYMAQNDYITSDQAGWNRMAMQFMVDENLAGQNFKIYLWNKGKKVAYFDDLIVEVLSNQPRGE